MGGNPSFEGHGSVKPTPKHAQGRCYDNNGEAILKPIEFEVGAYEWEDDEIKDNINL